MGNNLLNNIDNIKDPDFLAWIKKKILNNPMVDYANYNLEELYLEYNNSNSNSNKSVSEGKKRVLSNGHTSNSPLDINNQFIRDKNGAFANWYGIVLTLIFSFAIGYLIAWLLLKMR